MRSRATMRDVAALADASLKTVSRVVNDEPGVSAALAARVRVAVDQLDYRHNLAASNLRRGQRTLSIGVLIQDVSNSYSAAMLRAVEDCARERGVAVFAASIDEEEDRERDLIANLVSRRVDGLVLMPTSKDHSYLHNDIRSGLAMVFVDRPPVGLSVDSVQVDNRSGAADAVRHLIAGGHRRIAFLGDRLSIDTAAQRAAGYDDALRAAGLQGDPAVRRVDIRDAGAAERTVLDLMTSADPPTAIFAGRNANSLGAVRALRVLGYAHRIALVGYDDFPMSDLLEPAITVIQQNVSMIGREAGRMLLERIDGYEGPGRRLILPTTLLARGSGEIRPTQLDVGAALTEV